MNPIETAVLPLKQKAIDRAVAAADREVVDLIAELETANWDASAVAPYPNSGNQMYFVALQKYKLVAQITKTVGGIIRFNGPNTVILDQAGIDQYLRVTARDAAEEYDAYVAKLNVKVGAAVEATLEPIAGVWFDSKLHVTLTDGTKQIWSTKCILNRSKHNKLFNQFPTRQIKR